MTEVPPGARPVTEKLTDVATSPVKVLITGGIGTGKTTALGAAREVLRAAGITVLTRPPRPDEKPTAVVIDDAHLLGDDELNTLAALADDPAVTVVVATEPRDHHDPLRALTTAIERENPRAALGPLPRGEIVRLAGIDTATQAGALALANLVAATAGLPFLVHAALAPGVGPTAEAVAQAALFGLIERVRKLDEPVLDALLITSLSPGLGAADLAAALGVDTAEAAALVDRAHATGLLEPSHGRRFLRTLHRAVSQVAGNARHHDIEATLLRSQVEMGTLAPDLALRLGEHGVRDPQLAAVLEQAGVGARAKAEQARLYRAAIDAGATTLAAPLADTLALIGDCPAAAALSDELLGSTDPGQRAAAVRIAASVAAHDGNTGQAAELFGWLGSQVDAYPDAVVGAAGAIVLTAAGDLDAARAALRSQGTGPPTSTARTARNLADGLLATVDAPYAVAVSTLGQSIAGDAAAVSPVAMPDSPAALVALAALHAGDAVRARSVLGRAVRSAAESGGETAFAHRHTLMLAWVKMLDGQLAAASADAATAGERGLHRRDALWASALRAGIARRGGDAGALQRHWYAAVEVLAEYSIDLFSLLPLGELWVAAARIHQEDRLRHALDQAFALLARMGDPPSWTVPLHWAGVHAAILANSPGAVAPHGQALARATDNPFARALADAGRSWLRVLAGQVDIDDVTAAARGLSQFGLTWDATRLAGQAALQTPDARVSGAMLQIARDLKLTAGGTDAPPELPGPAAQPPSGAARTTSSAPAGAALSDREREVAELLLLGMPYRDIGGQLFISAKTVEHHVARIRRRLGAESRSEMLSMLRAMLAAPA